MLLLLKELRGAHLTKAVLEASKLGVALNKIRKEPTCNEAVSELATKILLDWREVMLAKGSAPASPTKESAPSKESSSSSRAESGSASPPAESSLEPLPQDATRQKCVEMLIAVIGDSQGSAKARSLALAVEGHLFAGFKEASPQYKTQFRMRYMNLKRNESLRQALLSGSISPLRFCQMTLAEMASEERRKKDQILEEHNLREAKAAQDNEAETDQFKCGRCQQRRTKYYQLQTRSADEPMTTFVTCINCGNKWKFC